MSNSNSTSWSPFDCLAVAETTASGLLAKQFDSEVELLVQAENVVELRAAVPGEPLVPLTAANNQTTTTQQQVVDTSKSPSDWVDKCPHPLQLIVTTHRLVFLTTSSNGNQQRQARYLHLCNLFSIQEESKFLKSPKLVLSTAVGDLLLAYTSSMYDAKKQRDECHAQLKLSLSRRQWEQDEKSINKVHKLKTTHRVGVDAILAQSKAKHRQAERLTDTAFEGDAESLLKEATELVQIIHKYVATLDHSSSSSGGSSKDSGDSDRLIGLLQDMGMTSALRKADYKGREDAYFDTTARQLADFVRPKLRQTSNGGMLTLTDVYCLFNRARGSHLLSPEDLLEAVHRLERLRIGISLYTFPDSGLKVLRDESVTDEALAEGFLALCRCEDGGCVTALTVSRSMHVSAVLALEQLQEAERAGVLVRDETLESIRFFPNRFDEWCASAASR